MDLYKTYNCIEKMESIKEEFILYKEKINNAKNKSYEITFKYMKVFLIIIDVLLIFKLIIEYLQLDLFYINNFSTVSSFFNIVTNTIYIMFILFIILTFNVLILKTITPLISKFLNKIIEKHLKEDINTWYNEQLKLFNEYTNLKESLNNSIVPKRYRTIYAIRYIVSTIENKRANSLSEAINLYEENCENIKKYNSINELISVNENLRNELEYLKKENEKNKKLSKKAIEESKKCLFRL